MPTGKYKRKPFTKEHKNNIRKNHADFSGENAPGYIDGRTLKKYYCKNLRCKKEISYQSNLYGKGKCKSCANSKRNNPRFGKITSWKRIKYKNIWMKSSWEVAYAKWLDKRGIKWEYEPKTFDLGNTTYTPDFYLSELKKYIEIKGWFRKKYINKINLFKKKYPKLKIEVLMYKKLKYYRIIK